MAQSAPPDANDLGSRLEAVGRELGRRESPHAESLAGARSCAERLHADVSAALERFHAAAAAEGATHLRVEISPIRTDDKHLRAVEFDLVRGRYKAVVTAKSRGEVTLVGPFQVGKTEGPCRTFPIGAQAELCDALGEFVLRFVEEASSP